GGPAVCSPYLPLWRALPDLSPREKRWGKGPACGYYRICPPERSDGGRDPLAGTTGSVPQGEAMGEGTRLRVGGHQTRPRTPETPTSGVPTPSPAPPVLTGSVPQSEAMGAGTRLRVRGRQTRARPTSGVPTLSPASPRHPAGYSGS